MMVVHGAWHALGSIRGCVEGQQPSYGATSEVAEEMRDAARGKTVIDATNPLKDDYSGLAVTGRSGAEEIQGRLGGAHVVKAFNTVRDR